MIDLLLCFAGIARSFILLDGLLEHIFIAFVIFAAKLLLIAVSEITDVAFGTRRDREYCSQKY